MNILKPTLLVLISAFLLSACQEKENSHDETITVLRKTFDWDGEVKVHVIGNGIIFEHGRDVCIKMYESDGELTFMLLNLQGKVSVNLDSSLLGFTLRLAENSAYDGLFIHDMLNEVVHTDKDGIGDFTTRELFLNRE